MAAPRGRFTLNAGDTPVLLLSAGIGATPVLAMLHALARHGPTREVWWLHGARNSGEHPFAAEVRTCSRSCRTPGHICYSAPLPTDRVGRDYTRPRSTSERRPRRAGPPARRARLHLRTAGVHGGCTGALARLGVDPARVHTEVFGAGQPSRPASPPCRRPLRTHPGDPGPGPEVTFARSGLTVPWREDFASLLELAEACDVPTRWSCRTGVCHTCEAGLLAGSVTYDPPPVDPPADGQLLVCCAAPDDDVVIDL